MTDWATTAAQIAAGVGHPWPALFAKQMALESINFSPAVISCQQLSPAGARGIAQFMPATAAGLGIDPCNPTQALAAAARLMVAYYRQYGDWAKALAAYNAGPGAVAQYGGVPPFAETRTYVRELLGTLGPVATPADALAGALAAPASQAAGSGPLIAFAALAVLALAVIRNRR